MNQPIVPPFEPSHIWTETVIMLRNSEGNIYGEIHALYPTAMDGNPDFDGERQPEFQGRLKLMGMTTQGQQFAIPLSFPLPYSHPIEAAMKFQEHAHKAIEEWQSANFRQTLIQPGVKPQ